MCHEPALARTQCLIQAALEDLAATYPNTGGGGIVEIKALSTLVYRISIAQEERVDLVTYEFEIEPDGRTRIVKRTEGVK